jgi:hypothetical protein
MLRAGLCAVALAGLALAARAQEAGGGASDSALAGADTTKTTRQLVSSDGSITAYVEAYPGEGKEGFYWTFDAPAELVRLLDKDKRQEPRPPLVDLFGFPIAPPESIRALRDSVLAVADSILAQRIDLGTGFDPRFRSAYVELKDDFQFNNSLESNYLISSTKSLLFSIDDQNAFNESTRKRRDDRTISTGFNFVFNPNLNSSLTLLRSDNRQVRVASQPGETDQLETEGDNTSVTARAVGKRQKNVVGGRYVADLETSVGITANRRNYETATSRGKTEQIAPNWSLKLQRPYEQGRLSFDYGGDLGRARSEETPVEGSQVPATPPTRDLNFSNQFAAAWEQKLGKAGDVRMNGTHNRNRFQYLSQEDSLRGQQETRSQQSSSLNATYNGTFREGLTLRVNGDVGHNQTEYDLETQRFSRTSAWSGDSELNYDAWEGSKFTFKFERSYEDRDYLSNQAGQVAKRAASVDYRQRLTKNVDMDAGYFVRLDQYMYDDFDGNKGDRDLLNNRANVVVRYNPRGNLNTAVRMESRQTESVNIHPERSGDNKTDETFLIEPSYTLRLGKANFTGDFTADATYAVYDFEESKNFLVRRFATRQKWQHAITNRVSTEVLFTYDLSDEGSYVRNEGSDHRVYTKGRETRRHRESGEVRYSPQGWIRFNLVYRQDSDEQFSVRNFRKTLTTERDVYELSGGLTIQRKITDHVLLDLNYSQTQKRGDRISDVERNFYNIRASLEYQPFKRAEPKEGES